MKKFSVMKIKGLLFFVIVCTTSASKEYPHEVGLGMNHNIYNNNNNNEGFSFEIKPGNSLQSQYYLPKSSFNFIPTITSSATQDRMRPGLRNDNHNNGRLGDGCNTKSGGANSYGLSDNKGYHDDKITSKHFIPLGLNSKTISRYPSRIENTKNGNDYNSMIYNNADSYHAMQSLPGGIGYGNEFNTKFGSSSGHSLHDRLDINNQGGFSIGNIGLLDRENFSGNGVGILNNNNGFGGSNVDNSMSLNTWGNLHGSGTSGTLEVGSSHGSSGSGRLNNNNFRITGSFGPQKITSINTADLTGESLSLAEQERIYSGNYRDDSKGNYGGKSPIAIADPVSIGLAYKKLLEPLQQLANSYKPEKTVKENRLLYGPKVPPIDAQQKNHLNEIPEEKLQILDKPIIELSQLDSGRKMPCASKTTENDYDFDESNGSDESANSNRYPLQVTYNDLDHKSTPFQRNNFITSVSLPSVFSNNNNKKMNSITGNDKNLQGHSSPNYQSRMVDPGFDDLSLNDQRQIHTNYFKHGSKLNTHGDQSHQLYPNEYGSPLFRLDKNINIKNDHRSMGRISLDTHPDMPNNLNNREFKILRVLPDSFYYK